MRVTIIGPAYPLRGGIAHFLASLHHELKEKGHEVSMISFIRQYPSLLFPGQTQMDEGDELIKVDSIRKFDPMNPISWIRSFMAIRRLGSELLVLKWWIPFFGPSYFGVCWLARHLASARVLFICDNVIPHEKRPGDTFFTKLAFSQVDYYVVMSRAVQEELKALKPNSKSELLEHPTYDMFGRSRSDKASARKRLSLKKGPLVLFFGYVREYKGLMVLLDSIAVLRSSINPKLLVVGEFYDQKQKYVDRIDELGIQDMVEIRDTFVPNEDVNLYFSAADVVVLPYLSASQSGIIQISFALDRPVITTKVGGLPEVVLDGKVGFVVEPGHPQDLAAAIEKYFVEGWEERFVENIPKHRERFSWTAFAEGIERLAGLES
jgi:glycosyltransferase involved in cell wall biosynthesis